MVERYAPISSLVVGAIDWYRAFGRWRTVVILQQLYARFVRGESAALGWVSVALLSRRVLAC
ncbi:hypothetical protein ACWPOB_25965 [Rhodococcus sp. 2H158]